MNNQFVDDNNDNNSTYHDTEVRDVIDGAVMGVSGNENGNCGDIATLGHRSSQLDDECPELTAEVIGAHRENNSKENSSNDESTSLQGCVFRRSGESLPNGNNEDSGKDFNELFGRTRSSSMARHELQTRYNHNETSRLAIDQMDLVQSKLTKLLPTLRQIATNSGQEHFPSFAANCRQELEEIFALLGTALTDLICTESKDIEVKQLDKTKVRTARENELSNSNKDCTSNWRLENQLLRARVEETLLENRSLKVDLENVKQLVAASRELKRENEALLGEYRDFKQQVLNTRCQDCLTLINQNQVCISSAAAAGETQFQENWHVEGVSTVYLACKESRQTNSSVSLNGKRQSVSQLTKIFESRLQDCGKQLTEGDRTKARTKSETKAESTSGAEGAWEYADTGTQPSYCELSEEIQSKTAIVQRNLAHTGKFKQDSDRLMAENEQMMRTIVDLRTKMGHETGEVAPLNGKLVDLERQLIKQIEDLSIVLNSLVKRNDANRRRLADEGIVQISASARPQTAQHRTSEVKRKIDDDFSGVQSLKRGAPGTSEFHKEFSKDDHNYTDSVSYKEVVCDILPWNGSDALSGSPVHRRDCVLLSKHYVEDLLAEIEALKRTVAEQSRYLQTVDDETAVTIEDFLANGEKFSTRFPGENICREKQASVYRTLKTEKKSLTSVQPIIFDAGRCNNNTIQDQENQVEYRQVTFSVDENGVENQDRQRNIENSQVRSAGISDLVAMKALNFDNSERNPKYDEILPHCPSGKQNNEPLIYQTKRGWPTVHRTSFDAAYKATFCNIESIHNVVLNMKPSRLKRALSEGDITALEFAGKSEELHPIPVEFTDNQTSVNWSKQFRSDEKPFQRENWIHQSDECLQTDEMDFGTKPNGDAETVKRYKALLANLRKTCDLANAFHSREGNSERPPEISEEDCLSVDELLLLINSYEQLNNEKKILEEENRIFGMEVDELASRLIKAEEKENERSLPSISEENLQEQIAEMEDRLDTKEAELSELRKILFEKYESEKIPWQRFRTLQNNKEMAEKIDDMVDKNVEIANCTNDNNSFIRQTNLSMDKNLQNELHVRPTEQQECGHNVEFEDELKQQLSEKGSIIQCSEPVNKKDTISSNEEFVKAGLCHVDQDLSEMVASLRPEIFRLEAENGRLREEVGKWKRLKQFQVDDAESMFCVQERLANELEQLSRKLESTRSELAGKDAACRQLEAAYSRLKQEKEHLANDDDGKSEMESVAVDVDVIQNVVEKVCLLQVANSNLVEETVKLAVQLETEDLKTSTADENVDSWVADKEESPYDACNGAISRDELERIHDFPNAWRVTVNGTKKSSSETSEEQEMMAQQVVPEANEMENGDSEQSRWTAVTQPAIDADANDRCSTTAEEKTTHSTVVVGTAKRLSARDLVCSNVVQLFYGAF